MKYCLFKVRRQPPQNKRWIEKTFIWTVIKFVKLLPIPEGNPYWKWRYEKAEDWWIEADDSGSPVREIGFDADGHAVVISPLSRNMGFIIDSNVTFEQFENDTAIQKDFERIWSDVKEEMLAENPISP